MSSGISSEPLNDLETFRSGLWDKAIPKIETSTVHVQSKPHTFTHIDLSPYGLGPWTQLSLLLDKSDLIFREDYPEALRHIRDRFDSLLHYGANEIHRSVVFLS